MNRVYSRHTAATLAGTLLPSAKATAHGFAGDRFFRVTILTQCIETEGVSK
jgi:hypothetical protein